MHTYFYDFISRTNIIINNLKRFTSTINEEKLNLGNLKLFISLIEERCIDADVHVMAFKDNKEAFLSIFF